LSLLAEVLRNVANKAKTWIGNEPMNEDELTVAQQTVERWARNAPASLLPSNQNVSFGFEKQAIENIVEWMYTHFEQIEQLLKDTVSNTVPFLAGLRVSR